MVPPKAELGVSFKGKANMTDAASPPGSPPGWYPAPDGQPVQRWWNGTAWTSATLPLSPASSSSPLVASAAHDGDVSVAQPGQSSLESIRIVRFRWRGRDRRLDLVWMPVWSFGFLAFAPFLRLALARRTAKAWRVFAAYLAAVVVQYALAAATNSSGAASPIGAVLAVALMGTASVHAYMSFRPAPDMLTEPAGPSSSLPNQQALATAQARMQRRKEARELARANPVLARELRIGRPDLPRQYDDGGLVDVNQVPAETMTSALELTAQEAAAVAAARTQLGKFTSPEELSAYAQLEPDRVDAIRDLLWFG